MSISTVSAAEGKVMIPWPIALEVTFLDVTMEEAEYREHVKNIVRRHTRPMRRDLNIPGPYRMYDPFIQGIMSEVLSEN